MTTSSPLLMLKLMSLLAWMVVASKKRDEQVKTNVLIGMDG
ncbi:hypothetical protein SN4111_02640 [Ligilactobacillus agilis]|nr:hypothetical protein SN4111_02640 [Ligilactobacillus agilis]